MEHVRVAPNEMVITSPRSPSDCGSSQCGNSGTMLVTSGHNLLVLKEHIHEENNWSVPFNVLNDIATCLYFYTHPHANLPSLTSLSIGKNTTRIITSFIPLAFEDVFDHQLPLCFLQRRFWELASAIAFMHSHGFAHRDIKPENIRLRDTGEVVLIDFDTCCRRTNFRYFTRPACSPHTRAPELDELSSSDPYDARACDVFAAGCVMHAMAMDTKLPFGLTYRKECIQTWVASSRLLNRIGDAGVDLLSKMLSVNPAARPSMTDILGHKFFH